MMRTRIIPLWTVVLISGAVAWADLPPGPGKEETIRACSRCHSPELVSAQRLTHDQWQATISKMANLGAEASDNEFEAILNYVSQNFGPQAAQPVNVNKATAVEIECVLGLTRTESRAIVQYRQQHGPLKALDDLSRVPGVDSKKSWRVERWLPFNEKHFDEEKDDAKVPSNCSYGAGCLFSGVGVRLAQSGR